MNHSGEVGLLYVAPEARFLLIGAGTLMLEWLENEAVRLQLETVFLDSSLTAQGFYDARGYIPAGEPTPGFGITRCWLMMKFLNRNDGV